MAIKQRISCPFILYLRTLTVAILIASAPTFALVESAAKDGCNVQTLHALGYRGEGIKIGLITVRHARTTHEAFFDTDAAGSPVGSSYVTGIDTTDNPAYEPDWHDTAMAGILASRGGSQYPNTMGMAPGAEVCNAKITQPDPDNSSSRLIDLKWIEDALDQLAAEGVRTAVTGFQITGKEADGQSAYARMYDYYADRYDILFANPAGNAKPGVTIFGDSCNGLTIAGLATDPPDAYSCVGSTSNPGPTADGRRKPDIAAPAKDLWVPASSGDTAWTRQGNNGETSWAGPHAAGCAAVLFGYAQTTTDPDDDRGEVIKAALVNSAFPNINDKSNQSTTGQVWHPQRGYGRIDTLRAFDTLAEGRIDPTVVTQQAKGWAYREIAGARQEDVFLVSGLQNHRLLVTVTWLRRIIKNGPLDYTIESPMFNLDLTISDPTGQVLFAETDSLNNLEKADLLLPLDGIYEISIANSTSYNGRDYALAFELLPPLAADFNTDYIVDLLDLATLTGEWLQSGCRRCPLVDLEPDGIINTLDFAQLARHWQTTDPRYYPLP